MKLALCPFSPLLGDFDNNIERLIATLHEAERADIDLLLAPELALSGYPPEDWLLRPGFVEANERALGQLQQRVNGRTALLAGHFRRLDNGRLANSASLWFQQQHIFSYDKRVLPNDGVFDEARYFQAGTSPLVFSLAGVRMGVVICEDLWQGERILPPLMARQPELILALNASPFEVLKPHHREQMLLKIARRYQVEIAYVNLCGAQDELVFDGHSFWVGPEGVLSRSSLFSERWFGLEAHTLSPMPSANSCRYQAAVLGLASYARASKASQLVLGLSGGMDSALAALMAVDAVGAERVHALMLSSPYTSTASLEDAASIAQALGIGYSQMSIEQPWQLVRQQLVDGPVLDITDQNLQSRLRGLALMAWANQHQALVVNTTNKSELACGYGTLYGDLIGAYAPLKDVFKTQVYELAQLRDPEHQCIPKRVFERAPSAELAPDQKDSDSLPPYQRLDKMLAALMAGHNVAALVQQGFSQDEAETTARLLFSSEYKRRQAPIGPKLSATAFGRDWRFPLSIHPQLFTHG